MREWCTYVQVEGMDRGKREKLSGDEMLAEYLIATPTFDSKTNIEMIVMTDRA